MVRTRRAVTGILAWLAACAAGAAQEPSVLQGKQVTIIVGTAAGGGYDAYARLMARHLPKHLPGAPNVVVSNMPGAGSNQAAQYVYAIAPKDGTTIGSIYPAAILEPLIGSLKLNYDPSRFHYLGSVNDDVYICIARKDAAAQSFEDLDRRDMVMGATIASSSSDFSSMLANVLGARMRVVLGYQGSRTIALAMERNEVQGACGFAWPAIGATNPGWFAPGGPVRVLVQTHGKGHPELNAMGVPLATSFARTDEQRRIMELYFSHTAFGRPYVLAPETPPARVALWRKSFLSVLADPELLAEAKRAGLDVNPVSGEEVQTLIERFYAAPPALTEKIRQALVPPK